MPGGDKEGWRFDLRINVPLILTLVSIAAAGAWEASRLWAGFEENRRRIIALEAQLQPIPLQLIRVEALLESVDNRMAELVVRVRDAERASNGMPGHDYDEEQRRR
jgi:hypothetical protein